MKIGNKGQGVKDMQMLLIKNGFLINADGNFGEKTDLAIKKFQKDNGLAVDGIVGPKTIEYLEDGIKAVVTEKSFESFEGSLDARTEKNLKSLDPKAIEIFAPFVKEAQIIAQCMGYDYFAISGHRDEAEQNAIYAKGRTGPGKIVTNARYPYSNHNYGIALDFGVFKNGTYVDSLKPSQSERVHRSVSQLCKNYLIDWGGHWKFQDFPHFEVRTGLTIDEKIKRIKERGTVF